MNLLELTKGTHPRGLIELQNPSLSITLTGAIEISRFGLTPNLRHTYTDKTSLKADREDWGEGAGPTAPGVTAPRPNRTGGSSAENHKIHAKT